MLEDLLDFLKCQAGNFRVEEVDHNPADTADGGIEAKCAARGHPLHHAEEGGGDNDVAAPAGAGEPHGAHSSDLHREEICAHPRGVADRDTIKEDEPDDEAEDSDGWTSDIVACDHQSTSVDGNEAECNCNCEETS